MRKITVEEYLMNRAKFEELSADHKNSTVDLLDRVNKLLEALGREARVSSGIRTKKDHERIYRQINAKRKEQGLDPIKVPMGSKHLSCQAVDLADPNNELDVLLDQKEALLEEYGLYREHPDYTKGWVHLQTVAPGSGLRTFKPY